MDVLRRPRHGRHLEHEAAPLEQQGTREHRLHEDRIRPVVAHDQRLLEDLRALECRRQERVHPHLRDAESHEHPEPGDVDVRQRISRRQGARLRHVRAIDGPDLRDGEIVEMEIEVRGEVWSRGMAMRFPDDGQRLESGRRTHVRRQRDAGLRHRRPRHLRVGWGVLDGADRHGRAVGEELTPLGLTKRTDVGTERGSALADDGLRSRAADSGDHQRADEE